MCLYSAVLFQFVEWGGGFWKERTIAESLEHVTNIEG